MNSPLLAQHVERARIGINDRLRGRDLRAHPAATPLKSSALGAKPRVPAVRAALATLIHYRLGGWLRRCPRRRCNGTARRSPAAGLSVASPCGSPYIGRDRRASLSVPPPS